MRRKSCRPLLVLIAGFAAGSLSAQSIPKPESSLGFKPGDDFKLARYEESIEYFRKLDAASDYVQLQEVGRTSNGKPWTVAFISSPENLRNLERHRATAQRIAHPAG